MNQKASPSLEGSLNPDPGAQAQDVIDRLYAVAVDPSRYEELLDKWETLISPYRRSTHLDQPVALSAIDFESHFQRASKVLDSLDLTETTDASDAVLAPFDTSAAFTVSGSLTVSSVNKAAASALGLREGADLSALPLDMDETEALAEQIRQVLATTSEIPAMFRARVKDGPRLMVIQLRAMYPDGASPFVVAVTSELIWPDGFTGVLRSVFDLTEAETEILRALSECYSIKEIAERRGRSVETVRAQLKSLQAKTETRSQSELVRLTLSTMDIATFTEDVASEASTSGNEPGGLETRPFHTLTLPDGRRMDYLILGHPNGRPCIFLPQDYGLTRWPAPAEARAVKEKIKVIVPIRPGYGNSDPVPRGTHLAEVYSADLLVLLDHLNIPPCPFISLGGDFYWTAQLHKRHPDRITLAIACSGVLPMTRSEQYERMDKWHRFILAGARYTPHLLPFMVKAGFALARKLGKRGFVQAVYGKSPADVATFEQSEVFEAMVVGSEVALSKTHSAHAAFSAEIIEQEVTDWRDAVMTMQDGPPVHFFNGRQDPQMPSDTLDENVAAYPWINFTIHNNAGQLIFFQKWPEILNILVKKI